MGSRRVLPLMSLLIALVGFARAPAARGATGCYTDLCTADCSPDAPVGISTLVPAAAFPAGADTPIAFIDPKDGRDRRLIATQQGSILVWEGTTQSLLPTPFLDLRNDVGGPVLDGGERGLLALAVEPDYAETGRFYVFYTRRLTEPGTEGDIVIERYERSATNPDRADPASATTILVLDHPASNHNGGWLEFGPDGFLYISTGDGGGGCDSNAGINGDGQRSDTLHGKMLRIDVRAIDPLGTAPDDCSVAAGPYTVPSTNPFSGQEPACDEVWALGLRNPFRFSFDRETGDLYIGDVGQNKWEEINLQAASTPAPVNFGWVCREGCETSGNSESGCLTGGCPMDTGTSCQFPRPTGGFWDPILCHYNGDWRSIMGGYRYRGVFLPSIAGDYIYGDASCDQLWKTAILDPTDPASISSACWASGLSGTFGFGQDRFGELYVVRGGVNRIDCIHNGDGCFWVADDVSFASFSDHFESGDTSAWSAAAGGLAGFLAVTDTSAMLGGFGLEVTVGGNCSADPVLEITPPPPMISGPFLACNSITATGVEVSGGGATFRAGASITLGEAFSVSSGASFECALDPAYATGLAYVQDDTPNRAVVYEGRFAVRLDDLSLIAGDQVEIFNGYSSSGTTPFRLFAEYDSAAMGNRLGFSVRQDDGTFLSSSPLAGPRLNDGWNMVGIEWQAGAGTGFLTVTVNFSPAGELLNLDNDEQVIDRTRLGYVGGTVTTSNGTFDIDRFAAD